MAVSKSEVRKKKKKQFVISLDIPHITQVVLVSIYSESRYGIVFFIEHRLTEISNVDDEIAKQIYGCPNK